MAAWRPRHRCAVAPRLTIDGGRRRRRCRRADRRRRPGRTPTPRAWPTRSPTRRPGSDYSAEGYRRIVALADELSVLRATSAIHFPTWSPRCAGCSGVDWRFGRALPDHRVGRAPNSSTRSPTSSAGYAASGRGIGRRSAGLPGCGRHRRKRLAPAQTSRRPGPGAGADRARRQGSGVAGGRRAAPVGAECSRRPRQARTWLTDAADFPPLLRGDRASGGFARRAGSGHIGGDRIESSCRTRSTRIADNWSNVASTRSAGCSTWPSPALRTPCCCPAIIGARPGSSRAGRRISWSSSKTSSTGRRAAGKPCGVVEHWAPAPADGDRNPLRDSVHEALWPVDPRAGAAPTWSAGRHW